MCCDKCSNMKSSNPKNNNPSGHPETLTPFKEKWKSGKTRTIRVPIAIADEILEAARLIDDRESLNSDTSEQALINEEQVLNEEEIIKLARQAFVAKSNAGGQIKDLLAAILKEVGISAERKGRRWVISNSSTADEKSNN